MCFIIFRDQILEYLKPHEGQSLDLQVRGNLWIIGQIGHLNLMKPLDISLQARNLSTECIMYLRWFFTILFFLQKFIEFSRMLLLLKIYFSLFWIIYLLDMNILYKKSAEFQIRLFLYMIFLMSFFSISFYFFIVKFRYFNN